MGLYLAWFDVWIDNVRDNYRDTVRTVLTALFTGASATIDAQPFFGDTAGKYACQEGFQAMNYYGGDTDAGEAVRHEIWMAELAREHKPWRAKLIGEIHERNETDKADSARDQYNNELGLRNGKVTNSCEKSQASEARLGIRARSKIRILILD